jgi:MFS family permease
VPARRESWLNRDVGAWQERNFRLLFVGQTASALGNTLVPVALAFAVLDLTGSAADLGLVLGAEAAALVVFVLIGGVIADRFPRRTLMVAADSVRGAAQLTLGVLLVAGHPSLVTVIVLAVLMGIATALFTPASSGLIPSLVKPEFLHQANGLQQTAAAAAGIGGPALAGILVVSVGPGWAIIGDAATFFISIVLLAQLRLISVPRPARQHWVRDLRDGWTDFWNRRWFRTVVIGASAFNFLYSAYTVLGPVTTNDHYGGAGAWAIASTASAVGGVCAGLVAVKLNPRHPLRVALPLIAFVSLAPFALAALLPVIVVAIAAAVGGASLVLFEALWQTTVQRNIPEAKLSRAVSYDYFGSLIAYPVGLAVAGPLASAVGSQIVLLWVGLLLVILVLAMLFVPSVRNLRREDPSNARNPEAR